MKPLVVALILGGIVGAGGAAAFAVTSFTGRRPPSWSSRPAQTSSATAPASVGPEVTSSTTVPSASPSASSSAPYTSRLGAVHVGAGQHVLVADRAPLHDARHVDDTRHVHDTVDDTAGVRIDLFVRAREHVLVSSAALVDPAFVLVRVYVGEHTRVSAVIRPVLVTGRAGAAVNPRLGRSGR